MPGTYRKMVLAGNEGSHFSAREGLPSFLEDNSPIKAYPLPADEGPADMITLPVMSDKSPSHPRAASTALSTVPAALIGVGEYMKSSCPEWGIAVQFMGGVIGGLVGFATNRLASATDAKENRAPASAEEINLNHHLARLGGQALRTIVEGEAIRLKDKPREHEALSAAAERTEQAWLIVLDAPSGERFRALNSRTLADIAAKEALNSGQVRVLSSSEWLPLALFLLAIDQEESDLRRGLAETLSSRFEEDFSRHFLEHAKFSFEKNPPAFAALLMQFLSELRLIQRELASELKGARKDLKRVSAAIDQLSADTTRIADFDWDKLTEYLNEVAIDRKQAAEFYQAQGKNWDELFKIVRQLQKEQEARRAKEKDFEKRFRDHQLEEHRFTRLIGIRGAADVSTIDVSRIFISPQFQERHRSPIDGPQHSTTSSAETVDTSNPTLENAPQAEIHQSATVDNLREGASALISLKELLCGSRRTIVIGRPGSGKTTLARHLAFTIAGGKGSTLSEEISPDDIPIVLYVRKIENGFSPEPTLSDLVIENNPFLRDILDPQHIHRLFQTGRAVLIVDGLDECELPSWDEGDPASTKGDMSTKLSGRNSEWDRLIKWIQMIANQFPLTKIIATARPVAYRKSDSLRGFTVVEMESLDGKQQELFIRHWCDALAASELKLGIKKVQTADSLSTKLRSQIENNKILRILAETPLLLSVLCGLTHSGMLNPSERIGELLDDCIGFLLFDWRNALHNIENLPRNFAGPLNAKSLRSLLQPLAFQMQTRSGGKHPFERDEVEKIFAESLPCLGMDEKLAPEVLGIVRDRSGILVSTSSQHYDFIHPLFREFLAACECAERGDVDFVKGHLDDPAWNEVIPFAVARMAKAKETIIEAILKRRLNELAFKAMNECATLSPAVRKEVLRSFSASAWEENGKGFRTLASNPSPNSARCLMDALRQFPLASGAELKRSVKKWSTNSARWNVLDLATNSARRCHLACHLDLTRFYDGLAHFICFTDEISGVGTSWTSTSLVLQQKTKRKSASKKSQPNSTVADNFVLHFAWMLGVLDSRGGFSADDLMHGFKLFCEDPEPPSHEAQLLALALLSHRLASREPSFLDLVLRFLEGFPPEIAPAVQIGLLNHIMKFRQLDCTESQKQACITLWKREVDALGKSLRALVTSWAPESFIGSDDGPQASPSEVLAAFSSTFQSEIEKFEPFRNFDASQPGGRDPGLLPANGKMDAGGHLVYLVRGKDKGRPAWHYVKLDLIKFPIFHHQLATGTLDVADYGKILYSGWGEDPPREIIDRIRDEFG